MKRNWPRRVTIAAVIAIPAAIVLWLSSDRSLYKERFSAYSVYRTANDGMSLSYRYLAARREQMKQPGVNVISRPLEFAQVPTNGTLFRIAPNFVPAAKRKKNDPNEFGGKQTPPPTNPPAMTPPAGTPPAGTPPAGAPPGGTPPAEKPPEASPSKIVPPNIQEGDPVQAELVPPTVNPPGKGGKAGPGTPPVGAPPVALPPVAAVVPPEEKQSDLLTPFEAEWIEKGGRLVLAVNANHGPLKIEAATSYEKVQRVHPFLTGINQVEPLLLRRLGGWVLGQSHTLLASGSDAIAARWTLGKGEVILLACPEIFRNDHVGKAQHLPLLEVLAGDGRPVFFDEMVHGLRTDLGVIELLTRWGLGPLIGFGLLLCFLVYWRKRVGIGPPVDAYRETRREAVDLVDSMAAVYRRELPRWEALEIYHKELLRDAALLTEHRGRELETFVSKLMQGYPLPEPPENKDLTQQQLEHGLDLINEAFRRLHDAKSRSAVR